MNWITTNIRLPEDLYMELKMEAARARKSVAEIVRQRLTITKDRKTKSKNLLVRMRALAKRTASENQGVNFTKGIIEMRYEQ